MKKLNNMKLSTSCLSNNNVTNYKSSILYLPFNDMPLKVSVNNLSFHLAIFLGKWRFLPHHCPLSSLSLFVDTIHGNHDCYSPPIREAKTVIIYYTKCWVITFIWLIPFSGKALYLFIYLLLSHFAHFLGWFDSSFLFSSMIIHVNFSFFWEEIGDMPFQTAKFNNGAKRLSTHRLYLFGLNAYAFHVPYKWKGFHNAHV